MPRPTPSKRKTRRPAEVGVPVAHGNLLLHELRSRILGNTRLIRVWLPPACDRSGATKYPVLYLNDGQNLFEPETAFAGVHWQVGETATRLIAEKKIPPLIVVGIDNTGRKRLREYIPYKSRDPKVLHPVGTCYPEFLEREVMPLIAQRYPVEIGPESTGLGGSSLGGLITLYTQLVAPGIFGRALIESPSLFVADAKILDTSRGFQAWPTRMYVGMGTRETGNPEKDSAIINGVRRLAAILKDAGLGDERLRVRIDEGATHTESAWAARFPEALEFLFSKENPGGVSKRATEAGSQRP